MRFYSNPLLLCLTAGWCLAGPSVITNRLDDPRATFFAGPQFAIHADGKTDDGATLQAAIDKAGADREGIVFIPSGRYAIARTVYVRAGVRLFGYGTTRPVFVLPEKTPGFQKGMGVLFMFIGARPGGAYDRGSRVPVPPPGTVPPAEVPDANSGTFYSSMSNIDIEIGDGNPTAVSVRFHVAQHAFLTHMDFHIGSGLAGIYQTGNEAEDLHFYGGRYGILTEKTSPAWQFTLIDSSFEGQRDAAIREHEAGLTLIHDAFRKVPVAIEIDPDYYDQLWAKDCRFEDVSRAGLIISSEKSRLNEIGVENAVLSNVSTFALYRASGKTLVATSSTYRVRAFQQGVIVPEPGRMGEIKTIYQSEPLRSAPLNDEPAIRPLPRSEDWSNVRTLGVVGDGKTDDTQALQKAIDSHRVLYLPSGHYLVNDTLMLKPQTMIIGLHPTLTQIDLAEDTPSCRGVGAPRPVLSAPRDGENVLSGFGVYTGGVNPRAVGVLWRAGEHSLIDDVRFLGGHGSGTNPYNNNQTADSDLKRRWDGQYPSLWVMEGGGTFADIWTPDTFAQSGLYVSDTKVPGHVYEISVEHHVRNEVKLERVENWDFNALQTEEESGESPESLSLEIANCKNVTIANYHAYRVTRSRSPYPAAARVYNSTGIRFRDVHVNAESGYAFCDADGCGTFLRASKYPYENAIQDVTHHLEVREREFAALDIISSRSEISRASSRVQRLEDGFFSIAGAATDKSGKLYFVDRHQQRIYGWSAVEGLTIERDAPLDPVNLAFDQSGNLLVMSWAGPAATVYSFKPGSPTDQISLLMPQEAQPPPGAHVILPVTYWNNGEFRDQLNLDTLQYKTLAEMFRDDVSIAKPKRYVSSDGSVFLPAGRVVQQGPPDARGWRFSDNLDATGFISAAPGSRVFVSNGSEDVTYSARVNADGTLDDLHRFADRGGESVAVGNDGNVYVANGQIFVYNANGKEIGRIDVPERPIDLVFGGPGHQTLFILSHHALYSVEAR